MGSSDYSFLVKSIAAVHETLTAVATAPSGDKSSILFIDARSGGEGASCGALLESLRVNSDSLRPSTCKAATLPINKI